MSGVFLSYSRGDRPLAALIVQGLRALSVEVWWDEDMPGVNWQRELERRITALSAVLVIWTPLSQASENVGDEARLAQRAGKLVNVLIGVSEPPFPYDRTNGLPLDGWNGRDPHGGWTRLIKTLDERFAATGGASHDVADALRRREDSIQVRRQDVADLETAFADAQTEDAESGRALERAQAELAAAEEQLRAVVNIRGGPLLRRAGEQQLDAALAARTDAEQARRSAAASLAAASNSLSSARAELESLLSGTDPASQRAESTPIANKASKPRRSARSAATAARSARAAVDAVADQALPSGPPAEQLAAPVSSDDRSTETEPHRAKQPSANTENLKIAGLCLVGAVAAPIVTVFQGGLTAGGVVYVAGVVIFTVGVVFLARYFRANRLITIASAVAAALLYLFFSLGAVLSASSS